MNDLTYKGNDYVKLIMDRPQTFIFFIVSYRLLMFEKRKICGLNKK